MIYIAISIFLICVYGVIDAWKKSKDTVKDYISFREAIDLTSLPILTFEQDDNKYNFLLDTGSTRSIINLPLKEQIKHEPLNIKTTITGAGEGELEATISKVTLYLKGKRYSDEFQFADMTNAFDTIKKGSGVTLHGILGNTFLDKYNYIIDYSTYVAYSKK
jgi:hypothetical protein